MHGKPIRILMVEDSPTDSKLILRELNRSEHEIVWTRVETAAEMRNALETKTWDVVLSDWSLPTFSALEALSVLHSTGTDIPFIIVSGTVGEDTAVQGMRHGAHDYLLKDRLARLIPAIEREIREHETRRAGKRAEEALKRSEVRLRRLAESGIIGIAVGKLLGPIHEANDAYLRLIDAHRNDLEAGTIGWDRGTPADWQSASATAFAELKNTGIVRPWQKEITRRDGTRVPVLAGGARLEDDSVIAFLLDLTEQKHAEDALKRTEEQLRHAQKMESIGILAGGVAHDFNNLLSVILSYASMMASDLTPGDPMEEGLLEIKNAGERAAQLTHQLLAFSRRQLLRPRLTNLNEVVAGTDRLLRRLIGEDVELIKITPQGIPLVYVDPDQIAQVIINLAVNARDAMPNGGKLTVETGSAFFDEAYAAEHVGSRPGPHVMLAVTDTGIGMDRETQSRIFEPFFTTKDAGRGTGLGLSTVFGIVKQSGGSIWVYSEVDRGTSFRVYLPAADPDSVPVPVMIETAATKLEGSETILLVEDEERVRALATIVLRRYGYTVLEAAGGGDALLICEQHPATIHLLVTDVVMPRMSGRQLVERLKPIRPDMKVLYMSGYTANAIVTHGVIDSDVAFVQKPITPEVLAQAVRNALDAPERPAGAAR
ncbi:MAG: response regulator [Gemmatimonadaceae bacterium]